MSIVYYLGFKIVYFILFIQFKLVIINKVNGYSLIKMKKRMNSHKQLCVKDYCCGAKNDHENFLAATNRHMHGTSRLKKSDINRKKKSISLKIQKSVPQS